jgi:hypothetical protein
MNGAQTPEIQQTLTAGMLMEAIFASIKIYGRNKVLIYW